MNAKSIFLMLLVAASALGLRAQDLVTISGRVTDFNANPLDSVTVSVKDKSFNDLYTATTDKDGGYSLKVPKGRYYCIYAVNQNHYKKTKLEYWAWNVPAFGDLELNPQYERMELYGLNVFEPQVGPYDTYMLYFRPMSLNLAIKYFMAQAGKGAPAPNDTINIAPSAIAPEELAVSINGQNARVISVQKVAEYAAGIYMVGYLVQVQKNRKEADAGGTDRISVILHSKETNESGRADFFFEKSSYQHKDKR